MVPERTEIRNFLEQRQELTDRILVVDDDAELVRAIEYCLKTEIGKDWEVITADDGDSALEKFAKQGRKL